MSKDKFLRGAVILTMAGLMVKVLGSVNRILLSRLLGGEGIGLYQMAYPVYLLLLAITAAGVPVAISIVVSEYLAQHDRANVKRVFSVSLKLLAGLGLFLAALMAASAGFLVDNGILKDPRAYYAVVALTPAIFFGAVLACLRGYFQGHQLMTPTAVSQIAEQFIRVVSMLAAAYILLPYGLEYAAAGAAFGTVPGSFAGLCVLGWFYWHYVKRGSLTEADEDDSNASSSDTQAQPLSAMQIAKKLLKLALPVSCANILVPLTSMVDAIFVPGCLLAAGLASREATTQYGYLAGMAQPLLLMATIPTQSLATSMVPAISEAFTLKDMQTIEQRAKVAHKLCCLITLPAAVGMAVLAQPISLLLYGTSKASVAILHSAPAIWLLGMQQVTTGLLQGTGNTQLPMLHMGVGLIAKIIAVTQLTNATYGIAGAAWATNLGFALTVALNLWALKRIHLQLAWGNTLRIALAAALMGAAALGTHMLLLPLAGPAIATIAALCCAVVVYAALVLALRIVDAYELAHVGVVQKLRRKLKKVR